LTVLKEKLRVSIPVYEVKPGSTLCRVLPDIVENMSDIWSVIHHHMKHKYRLDKTIENLNQKNKKRIKKESYL
jgi:hypothetical protein